MRNRLAKSLVPLALLASPPATAQQACRLCGPESAAAAADVPKKAIHIEIDTMLDFSKAAHTEIGNGSVEIDSRTGERRFVNLVGLSGAAFKGAVKISGDPFRLVRITLPTRVTMNSTQGAKAEITNIVTDLPATPMLGADGTLTFSFGGKMTVLGGAAGEFHGRVAIGADYL